MNHSLLNKDTVRPSASSLALLGAIGLLGFTASSVRHAPENIRPNDNRLPAGKVTNGVMTVQLEARAGLWHPEGDGGAGLEVEAWGEPGKPLQNPGPLIRVREGTTVRATLRNSLAKPLTVFGFGATRGQTDSIVIAPGASRTVEFKATVAGTYYYLGKTGTSPFDSRPAEDTQLNGAIVVDPAGNAAVPADRIFLISWWFTVDSTSRTGLARATMAINGLSWPHTERIDLTQGDSAHWRVINLTGADHPMHLHGFYFRMDASGDGVRDTSFTPDQRRMEVTELLIPGHTMAMSWSPTRPGNWIFHCHFASHISALAELDGKEGMIDPVTLAHHMTDAPHQMYGLVLGIRVAPRPIVALQGGTEPRRIRLLVRSKPNVYGTHAGYSFILGGTPEESDPNALVVPGPALVLERGQPVAINIVNTSHQPAAIHWHGIELESYPDGVPDWSGAGSHLLRPIKPGDSLTVRFTPPRAGTFMYHSHFNEFEQISSGLYGPIIVLNRGERFDPETDRVMLISMGGPVENVIQGPFSPTFLNGSAQPAPMDLRAGVTYRLRFINIGDEGPTEISLVHGDKPAEWKAFAKDGAELPSSQATVRPAHLVFDPGEIYDFQFTPKEAGALTLKFGAPAFLAPPGVKQTEVSVRVR